MAQDNAWCDTWEEFFHQGMVRMLALEQAVHGPDAELAALVAQLYDKVIPRLLRPLTVLKSITPVLIHGDLWYGNCCTDNATGKPIVFDACVFWAHNECMWSWNPRPYEVTKAYTLFMAMIQMRWDVEDTSLSLWQVLHQRIPKTFFHLEARRRPRRPECVVLHVSHVEAITPKHPANQPGLTSRCDLHSSIAYNSSLRFRRE
jgi:hypothetical protein